MQGIEIVLVARSDWTGGAGDRGRRRFDREGYSCALAAVLAERGRRRGGDGRLRHGAGRLVLRMGRRALPGAGAEHPSVTAAGVSGLACSARRTRCRGPPSRAARCTWRFPKWTPAPVLAQQAVPVLAGDDEATLHERIKATERELYPATIAAFLERCTQERIPEGQTR